MLAHFEMIDLIPVLFALPFVVGIVWANLAVRGGWQPHRRLSGDLVMRRKIKGQWEFREPTPEERNEDEWWWAHK